MRLYTFTFFSVFFSATLFAHPALWIVGKTYVALLKDGQTKYWNDIAPSSYAFNEKRCELWAVDETSSDLLKFSRTSPTPLSFGTTDALVSNIEGISFFSRKAGLLERRSEGGSVSESYPMPTASDLLEIRSAGTKGYVSLHKAEKELTLTSLSPSLSPIKKTTVSSNADLWNVERLLVDAELGLSWVGYTATTPGHLYAPLLKSYTLDGTLKSTQTYKHRGIFWDFCLRKDHSVLYSYDVPSNSGFTVPLYSYLDSFTSLGMSPKVYSAETNYFIDALSCSIDSIFMVQRPIFGSDKSRIVSFTMGRNPSEEMLLTLPDHARKVFHCGE